MPLSVALSQAVRQAVAEIDALGVNQSSPILDNSTLALLENTWRQFESQAEEIRNSLISDAAAGTKDTAETIRMLDTLRWIRRVSYHVWRIVYYLSGGQSDEQAETGSPEEPE